MNTMHQFLPARRHHVSSRMVLYYWVVLLFFVALFSLSGSASTAQHALTYLGLWGAIGLVFMFLAGNATFSTQFGRSLDVFEIPIVLTIANLVLNSLAGAGVLSNTEKYLSDQLPSPVYVHYSLLLTSFGLFFMWIGYWFVIVLVHSNRRRTRTLPRIRHWDFSNPSLDRTLGLYALTILIRLYLSYMGAGERNAGVSFGVWQQWLNYIVLTRYLFFALIALQVVRRRWPGWLLAASLAFETVMIFISGGSGGHIGNAYLLGGILLLYRRKIPWGLVAIVPILLVFVIPITRSTRDITRAAPGEYSDVLAVYSQNVREVSERYLQNPGEALDFVVDFFFFRQGGVAQIPAIVMVKSPSQVPYLPAEDLLLMPFSLVPRAFWPGEKPEYGLIGRYFTQVYVGHEESDTSSAPTLVGSAYMYGGLPTVAIGMFFLGALAAVLYLLLMYPAFDKAQIGLVAIYLALLQHIFIHGGGALISVWQGVVQTGLVFLAVMVVLCIDTQPLAPETSTESG